MVLLDGALVLKGEGGRLEPGDGCCHGSSSSSTHSQFDQSLGLSAGQEVTSSSVVSSTYQLFPWYTIQSTFNHQRDLKPSCTCGTWLLNFVVHRNAGCLLALLLSIISVSTSHATNTDVMGI